jgi:hypothetical protein
MRLGKDQHHKTGQQFLILDQFHVALGHQGTEVQNLAVVYLPKENLKQFAVSREVLP